MFNGTGSIHGVESLGPFHLSREQTSAAPLFLVVDLRRNGTAVDRAFYFLNYTAEKDSLFHLSQTRLTLHTAKGQAVVSNWGKFPAVGVAIQRPGHADTFTAEDNYFWLDPLESRSIPVNDTDGIVVSAWNAEVYEARLPPKYSRLLCRTPRKSVE